MIVQMLHQNEIAQALRQIVQASSPLGQDAGGSDQVQIVPSRLIDSPGQTIRLREGNRTSDLYSIVEVNGAGNLQLDREVEDVWRTAQGARVQLAGGLSEQLHWVAQGRPELMPGPRCAQLPAIVIEPTLMRQPDNSGTNRSYLQEYFLQVYLLRRIGEGEEANHELTSEVEQLFNLLMSDPTLQDTCWHAQVTEVDTRPSVEAGLKARHPEVQVVRLEVRARRSEVWG
jgi:hypothetical protein